MPWSTLFNRRVVFNAIEMTDWQMYVEMTADGRHSFPRFTRDGPPRQERLDDHAGSTCAPTAASSPTTTTARRGAPSRATSTSPSPGRRPSTAARRRFSNGTVTIQQLRADAGADMPPLPHRRRQGRARPDRPRDRRRRVAADRRRRPAALARADLPDEVEDRLPGARRSSSRASASRSLGTASSPARSTCSRSCYRTDGRAPAAS